MFDPTAPRYWAAACQTDFPCPADRGEIGSRVDRMLAMVEQTVVGYAPFGPVKLIVFPEFAHAAPVYESVATLQRRLAVPIPNEHTERYHKKAADLDVYIQTGTFLEVDQRWPEVVFNTTCLIGPTGILTKYRKQYIRRGTKRGTDNKKRFVPVAIGQSPHVTRQNEHHHDHRH